MDISTKDHTKDNERVVFTITLRLTEKEVKMLGDIVGNDLSIPKAVYTNDDNGVHLAKREVLGKFLNAIYRMLPTPQRFSDWTP